MSKQSKPIVSIVDYGMGNLFSVKMACERVGLSAQITFNKEEILNSDAVILPGVGAFGDAMENLKNLRLIEPLRDFIKKGKPFLGICLGMQLLMDESEEFGFHKGLRVLSGKVIRFPSQTYNGKRIKVPQVGWNKILKFKNNGKGWDNSLLKGLDEGEFMYFVHSFYVIPDLKEIILSISSYEGIEYCSAICSGNIFACQFHPERSGEKGLQIYSNFAKVVNGSRRMQ